MFFMHNNIHGDQVYLRELQNFFFEVLGMMSITHYGCVGDGRTDNYANLQVAIDDANRRRLTYIYVPNGRYIYRGNLLNKELITFIGNSKAEIICENTGEKVQIEQFGVTHNPNKIMISDNVDLEVVISQGQYKEFTLSGDEDTEYMFTISNPDIVEVDEHTGNKVTFHAKAKGVSSVTVKRVADGQVAILAVLVS